MKKTTLLHYSFALMTFIVLSFSAMGQQRKISGVVLESSDNAPLDGATVSVKNSKSHAITKEDGKFELNVPIGKVQLSISFVGHQTKIVTLEATETTIQVNLSTSGNNQLNDVVIVGVQRQSKRTTTSAISTVLSKDIQICLLLVLINYYREELQA